MYIQQAYNQHELGLDIKSGVFRVKGDFLEILSFFQNI